MEANKIQVIDDQGNEKEFEVLFTFNNEELGKQYVLYYDTTVEEPSVFASIYDDAGQLFPIETPEEWEMVEEVFQSFMAVKKVMNVVETMEMDAVMIMMKNMNVAVIMETVTAITNKS